MSLNDRLEAHFREHPDEWIPMQELASVAGTGGWRNRVTDLRLLRKMAIENRVYRANGFTVSEYRFVPPSPASQACLDLSMAPAATPEGR